MPDIHDGGLRGRGEQVAAAFERLLEAVHQAGVERPGAGAPVAPSWREWIESQAKELWSAFDELRLPDPPATQLERALADLRDALRPHFLEEFLAGRRDSPLRVEAGMLLGAVRAAGEGALPAGGSREKRPREAFARPAGAPAPLTPKQEEVLEYIKAHGPMHGGEISEACGVNLEHLRKWCGERGALTLRGVSRRSHEGYFWLGDVGPE
jgi:nitroreductase